jgi:hypothetical protein
MSTFFFNDTATTEIYTSSMYEHVKKVLCALPVSKAAFEQSVDAISKVTKFINDSTAANIPIIELDQVNDLLVKLDVFLSEQLVKLDDGLDHYRAQLSTAIHKLIESLIEQKNIAIRIANEKTDTVVSVVKTRYEQALEVLASVLKVVREKYPQAYEQFSSTAVGAYNSFVHKSSEVVTFVSNSNEAVKTASKEFFDTVKGSNSTIYTVSFYLLKLAQPYVHQVIQKSTPYVTNAVEVSTPYVTHAKPYFDPLMERAQGVNAALMDNKLVGPYISSAIEAASLALDETKAYCIPVEQVTAHELVAAAEYENQTD